MEGVCWEGGSREQSLLGRDNGWKDEKEPNAGQKETKILTCLTTIPPRLWTRNTSGRRRESFPSRLSRSWMRSLRALSRTPAIEVVPTTPALYPNVIIRAFGTLCGRRCWSHVSSLVPVDDLLDQLWKQSPLSPCMATMLHATVLNVTSGLYIWAIQDSSDCMWGLVESWWRDEGGNLTPTWVSHALLPNQGLGWVR